jgi:hypothetical protein
VVIALSTLIPDPSCPLGQHLLGSKTHLLAAKDSTFGLAALRAEPLTGLGRFSRKREKGVLGFFTGGSKFFPSSKILFLPAPEARAAQTKSGERIIGVHHF